MAANSSSSRKNYQPVDVQQLIAEAILSSFVEEDEVDTRYNILRYMQNWEKEYRECDTHTIFEMVVGYCNHLSFEQLKEKYDFLKKGGNITITNKVQENMDSLFYVVFRSPETSTIYLYANGDIPVECEKLKTFFFEDEYYVLLLNKENNTKLYFKYGVEESENGTKEKLYPVEDERILEFFKFLKL